MLSNIVNVMTITFNLFEFLLTPVHISQLELKHEVMFITSITIFRNQAIGQKNDILVKIA